MYTDKEIEEGLNQLPRLYFKFERVIAPDLVKKFSEDALIKALDKGKYASVKQIVSTMNVLKTFKRQGKLDVRQCEPGCRRSFGDIYRTCNSYFDITVPELRKALIDLYNDGVVYTHNCDDVSRRVFKYCNLSYNVEKDAINVVHCESNNFDCTDEYGRDWPEPDFSGLFKNISRIRYNGYNGGPIRMLEAVTDQV